MHTSNWRPAQGAGGAAGDSSMETGNWRSQLTADLRQRIVNKIMDTLIRHPEQLKKIAVKLEEHIYTTATSQSDYIRKISMKTSAAEARPQNPMPNTMQSNSAANSTHLHEVGGVVGDSSMENGDWRAHLPADSRQRIVNKIVDKLNTHLPQYGPEERRKIAATFEEKSYTVATNQSDYLRKISLKLLSMDPTHWRFQLQEDTRQRIVNKITDTLIRHLPQYGSEFLKNLAADIEEKTLTVATSQSDYLRKISLKMLIVENRSQNFMPHTMHSNSANNSINPSDSV